MKWKERLFALLLFLPLIICHASIIVQKSIMGIVGAENYTYYSLSQPGTVFIFLHSYKGDADLYISGGNIKPTYDLDNHDLQSTTCGLDYLRVPGNFQRPITIAVYGHPSHDNSIFEMEIFIDDAVEKETPSYDSYEAQHSGAEPEVKTTPLPPTDSINEPESILWTILFSMLKVLFDILVD